VAAEKSMGRPLPRFVMAAPTAAAGVYWPAAIGADAEIGVAFSGRIRLPSGPYFLGLPRFFATFTAGPSANGADPVGGGTNTPLVVPISAVAAAAEGGGDWNLAGGGGGGGGAADAGDAAAMGPAAALASPDLVSMRAASRTRQAASAAEPS
jgi:hypothetical protein